MRIDLTKLRKFHWFEDENGNMYDGMSDLPQDTEYFTYHVVRPLVYTEKLTKYDYHPEYLHESNRFYKAMLNFKWFYNLMYRRMKKRGDSKTFKDIAFLNTGYCSMSDVIVAMVNSGDYTLEEAVYICANCCERCSNVLAYKYLDGKDGYPEYSEEWKRCNTECNFCRGE